VFSLTRDRLSACNLPRSGEPFPIQAKASAMPLPHGSWRNQNKTSLREPKAPIVGKAQDDPAKEVAKRQDHG